MTFDQYILLYFLSLGAFLLIDLFWLGVAAKNFYRHQLSSLMLDRIKWPPALIFYAVYIIGLLVLVVHPALEKSSLAYAVFAGALLGLISYSTYDLSNLATLKNWPLKVVLADIVWGTILTSVVATISYLIAGLFS